MKIDFATEKLPAIVQRISSSDLGESDKQFLTQTLENWNKDVFELQLSTSGSTGRPRSITLNRKLLEWSVKASTDKLGISGKQHVLCCLPVAKAGGALQLVRSYLNKWSIDLMLSTANPFRDIPVSHNYTLVSLSPFQVERILKDRHARLVLAGFAIVLVGGGDISADTRSQLMNLSDSSRFVHTYGMTETAGHIALAEMQDDGIFHPLDGVEVSVDPSGRGRIRIEPLAVEITTGDLLEMAGDGFRILGRSDFVINSGGLKIQPELLEDSLSKACEKIKRPEFFFYGMPDMKLGQRLVLIIKGNKTEAFDLLVNQTFSGVERPRHILYAGDFFYTNTGKIDRHKTATAVITKHYL